MIKISFINLHVLLRTIVNNLLLIFVYLQWMILHCVSIIYYHIELFIIDSFSSSFKQSFVSYRSHFYERCFFIDHFVLTPVSFPANILLDVFHLKFSIAWETNFVLSLSFFFDKHFDKLINFESSATKLTKLLNWFSVIFLAIFLIQIKPLVF